ncbi:MAG: DUF1311 domain-containing protein [Deltaproteobacteria bacterium]|nr:DUF1311 domain-containing protein [Deltaproteobacteria bacterium]
MGDVINAKHAAALLGLVALAGPSCRTEPPPACPPAAAATLVALRDRLAEVAETDRPMQDQVRDEMERAARPLAVLESGGRQFQATEVYLCPRVTAEDPWRCEPDVVGYADDTIHTTEFPPYDVVELAGGTPVRLAGPDGQPAVGVLRVGIGEPSSMHGAGYAAATQLSLAGDSTLVGVEPADGEQLLFALFDDPSGLLRKHVWVVRVSGHPKGIGDAGASGPCDGAGTQTELTRCFAQAAERVERALAGEFGALCARVRRAGSTGSLEALEAGQARWESYRDVHCRVIAMLRGGGSLGPMQEAGCRAMLAEQRRAALQALLADMGPE